jgi:hypothetical protein
LLVDLQSSTSDVNGAKVTDFICNAHQTSLARSKTHAFVIFSCVGAVFKISTGAALDIFFAGFWVGALSAGCLHME